MATRIGIDLVPTASVAEKLSRNPSFWESFLTESEWQKCRSTGRWLEHAAGRWAAKEAVVKVLRPARLNFPLTDIHIEGFGGAPSVHLLGGARELADDVGAIELDVSITHSGGFAAAAAILQAP